jgi:hypothetical protein
MCADTERSSEPFGADPRLVGSSLDGEIEIVARSAEEAVADIAAGDAAACGAAELIPHPVEEWVSGED